MRFTTLLIALTCASWFGADAQAPATGPLVLLLPTNTRAAALGNAWVAGRDETSVFYNPAQINPTIGFGGRFVRYGANGSLATLANAVTVNWLTLGWGVQVVEFKARPSAAYPFSVDDVMRRGSRDAQSLLATAGGSFLFKGFRTGLGIKFAEDRIDAAPGASSIRKGVLLGDFGLSHPMLSGTVGLAVQNFGDDSRIGLPIQTTLGWARQVQANQIDLGFAAQVFERGRWLGVGGGVEAGYGWIEGWSASLRAGARRPETPLQKPVTLGGTLNADHLGLDYALEFFDGARYAHHVSLRWRP